MIASGFSCFTLSAAISASSAETVTLWRSPAMFIPTVNSSVMLRSPQNAVSTPYGRLREPLPRPLTRRFAPPSPVGRRERLPFPPRDLGDLPHDFERPCKTVGELLEIVGNHDAHVGAHIGAVVGGDPFDQRSGIRERLVAEGECQALGAGVELFDIGAAAQSLDLDKTQ